MIRDALLLGLGYNATLVTLGAALLGVAAGLGGSFLFLRKRALVSDAISHATLPGVALAFIVIVSFGGDGRSLPGLMIGGALSSALGLLAVNWLAARTRLAEDAAIGAVLSVFFGLGVVLMTVIQTMRTGQQAGLESFLLGSTSGMLQADAWLIGGAALAAMVAVLVLRRPLTLAAFDPEFAATTGQNVAHTDLMMMGLVLAITVVGLKVVGLILIVALLIIPPVTARFWTERTDHVVIIAGGLGGVAAYVGAALSAATPDLPTGPIIVLVAFGLFALSLLLAPQRGALSALLRHRAYQRRVHLRQGLLALAQNQPIYEKLTLRLLRRRGWALPDGVATPAGRARASEVMRDYARWQVLWRDPAFEAITAQDDGMTEITDILTPDQLREVDARRGLPQAVPE